MDHGEGVRRRVLITGAAGRIGSFFAEESHARYSLRLMVQRPEHAGAIRGYGEVVVCDLAEADRLREACSGIDTVVHLAANPSAAASWDSLLPTNIVGTYNVFAAAQAAGCARVVFASSIHAVCGYPPDVQVKASDAVNPCDLYGVTKCFGEALGRYMAQQRGLSVIALRIGAYTREEDAASERAKDLLDVFISRRDLNQLITRCIEADGVRFAILNALSDNRRNRLDISEARELVGYAPRDDLARINPFVGG